MRVYLVGTADTKGPEIAYLHRILQEGGANVRRVDVGIRGASVQMEVSRDEVAAAHPDGAASVLSGDDRGHAVSGMTEAFARYCETNADDIGGIIGVGGSGGTAIVSAGMRRLAYGVPKVMVSTIASGDVAPYVDVSDIVMFPSVTDIAGLNRLSRVILHNAAQALLGMVNRPAPVGVKDKPAIGLSMFGVTTPVATMASDALSDRFDCLIFHATGTGGRAMERLLSEGILQGLIDLTTTEICDLLFGGVLPAAPDRLDVVARTGAPYVGSVGALDMVNFWAPDTAPAKFQRRTFYNHNSNVTLMRTTVDENRRLGEWIGAKLNACDGPVRFLLPEKGVSALDIEGGPFWDREADEALFAALRDTVTETDRRRLVFVPHHINDPEFAQAAASAFADIFPERTPE